MGSVPCRLPPWFGPARNVHVKSRLGGGRPVLRLGVLPKLGRRTSRLRRSFFSLTALTRKRGPSTSRARRCFEPTTDRFFSTWGRSHSRQQALNKNDGGKSDKPNSDRPKAVFPVAAGVGLQAKGK